MTKEELQHLIKECLNEIDFSSRSTASKPQPLNNLNVVVTVTGLYVNQLKFFVSELHRILEDNFDEDVVFNETLNVSTLPNKDKKIEFKFTITEIIDDLDLKLVTETLTEIKENLRDWSMQEDLLLDFNFEIKN